jgi:imidazole glycerol-phosphate synthase subunit HisH
MGSTILVDYGMGNIGSIVNMIKKIGHSIQVSSDYRLIENAEKIILPGVGRFDKAMQNMKNLNLIDVLVERAGTGSVPIMGICLGMHLLCNSSEEGERPGLAIIDAHVQKFKLNDKKDYKIPHMDWNTLSLKKDHEVFADNDMYARYYFAHSYHVVCNNKRDILATTNYGYDFVSSISKDNVIGVQFHPEKSHKYGMRLIKRFIEMPV